MIGAPPRRLVIGCALAAAAILTAGALAQGIQVTVDRNEATIQDQLILRVRVDGSQSARPQLPEMPGFDVYSRGQSTQMSFVNGRASSSVTYTYVLVPNSVGTFTIGEASVEVGGVVYRSSPFQVRILEASASPRQTDDVFVTVKVSTTKPYLGQQIIYTWRLYRRVRIGDARLEPQDFGGFLVEDLGEVREYETTVRGRGFLVSEIRKALFPQEEGTLEVPASRLTCQVLVADRSSGRSFFDEVFSSGRARSRVLRTQPIEIEVRPLPAPPSDFSGLVGRFAIDASASRAELRVGESATLELTVRGSGNVQMISEPPLPELPVFKVYDDKPRSSIDRQGSGISGSKSFRKALVPLQPGELKLPGLTLTYFDPEEGSYRTARSEEITFRVSPAAGPEDLRLTEFVAPTTGKVAVRILADDILPLYKEMDALSEGAGALRSRAALVTGLAAPPAVYFGLLFVYRRRRLFEADAGLRRRREALRRARKALRGLEEECRHGDGAAAARAASRCLREYIGDKLDVEGSALTPVEVDRFLKERGVDEELAARTHRLLERLEAAQYGVDRVEPRELSSTLRPLLKGLERSLGR